MSTTDTPLPADDSNPEPLPTTDTVAGSALTLPSVPPPLHPWDQWPHEPSLQYSWFLVYLSLGSARSIDKAAHVYKVQALQTLAVKAGTDPKLIAQLPATVSHKASQHWTRASIQYSWLERATRYDVYSLSQLVPQTVMTIFETLMQFARVTSEALQPGGVKPENWQEVKAAVETLADYISPEILQATIVHAGSVVVPTEPVASRDESAESE